MIQRLALLGLIGVGSALVVLVRLRGQLKRRVAALGSREGRSGQESGVLLGTADSPVRAAYGRRPAG
jgi:hypothetical protein